jgi:hypothetical protein
MAKSVIGIGGAISVMAATWRENNQAAQAWQQRQRIGISEMKSGSVAAIENENGGGGGASASAAAAASVKIISGNGGKCSALMAACRRKLAAASESSVARIGVSMKIEKQSSAWRNQWRLSRRRRK